MLVLTDEQWAVLGPLVEACRPHAKVPPSNLRRTISAIFWRHQNGAKWRALPEEFGPWWMAAQTFIRWSRLGVWERLLAMAQARGVALGMVFLDGTSIRAHQKAAGATKKAPLRRNGMQVRRLAVLVAAMAPRPARSPTARDGPSPSQLAPGQAHELPYAVPLLARLPGPPMWVVADRGYSSHAFRQQVWDLGARPAIPTRRDEAPVACPAPIYNNRNRIERLWARLKEWRAVATRYEKTATSFLSVLCLAATVDWLRR